MLFFAPLVPIELVDFVFLHYQPFQPLDGMISKYLSRKQVLAVRSTAICHRLIAYYNLASSVKPYSIVAYLLLLYRPPPLS